jgi:hypothetical protein
MVDKKILTPEEVYKKNQKKSKVLKKIAPFVFYGCLILSFLCLVFAIKNSFGNVAEIMELLDNKTHTGEELQANYSYLVSKYGEWVIGNGGKGFTITFVNVGNALFSGLMMVCMFFFIVFLVSAFVLGKWLLPKIADQINAENQDMVNLTVLRSQDKN